MAGPEPWAAVEGRVVVAGAGFVGHALAASLVRAGVPTTVVTRSAPAPGDLDALAGARLVVGDVRDPAVAADALRDARHVVWSVGGALPAEAEADPDGAITSRRAPIAGFFAVAEPGALADVVLISSGGTVYGGSHATSIPETVPAAPETAYGASNLAAEETLRAVCRRIGARLVVARCSNIYGPGQRGDRSQGLIGAALSATRDGRPMRMFGDGVRDYLYIDDLVTAIGGLVGRPLADELWNVGSGTGVSVRDVLATVEEVTGRPLDLEVLPARDCDLPVVVLDTRRLQSVVPFTPVPLREGIAAAWEAVRTDR